MIFSRAADARVMWLSDDVVATRAVSDDYAAAVRSRAT